MNDSRWLKLQGIFEAGWPLDERGRQALLAEQAGGDSDLHEAAEGMLRAYDAERQAQTSQRAAPGPRRFGVWQTERLLGRGGMGEVWMAFRADGQHQQRAAVKIMSRHLATEEYVERFRRERQLLARLEHPNIARLLDGGVSEEGEPYLVMEYVNGQPIDCYCREREVPLTGRLELMRTLCAAVENAHRNLVLHRDIKPSNVLVTADGALKLVDFGAARELDGGSLQTCAPVTPAYASPEQLRGDPVTTLSDIYGLGATMYSLLAGEAPYGGSNRPSYEVMRRVLEDEPPPARVAAPDTPVDLEAIVLKAMDKNPARRYASTERLRADIQRFLDHRPVEARPRTWTYRTARFVERHRVGVGLAALLVVSLLFGVALVARETKIAREQRILAEGRFNDVRQLAHTFLFDFHDAIQNLPGATPARRLVVQKALLYLDNLSRQTGNDQALERELVEAYLRVAEVQGGPGGSNLGDTAGALDSYRRALAVSERAAAREPQVVDWQRYLVRAHTGLGDILAARNNDSDSALQHYREAVRIIERMGPRAAPDLAAQFDVINVYLAMGDCLGNPGFPNVGDPQGAKDAYEKAERLDRSIAAGHPDNLRARRAEGLMEMRIGDVEMGSSDGNAAIARYENAARILEGAVALDPQNPATRLVLGNVTVKIGSALEVGGQTAAALAEYQKASDMERRLVQADPKDQQARNSYALSLRARAGLLAKSGNLRAALALNREALATFRQLLAADPQSARRQAIYADTLATIGGLAARENPAEAKPAYSEAMGIFGVLAARGAASPEDLSNYAEHLLTCPLPEFVDPQRALIVAQRAVDLSHASQPAYLEQLARAYWATGNAANAAATERRAAAHWPVSSPRRQRAQAMLAKFEGSEGR